MAIINDVPNLLSLMAKLHGTFCRNFPASVLLIEEEVGGIGGRVG